MPEQSTKQPYRTFDENEITDIFIYHAPTIDQVGTYTQITDAFIECAMKIVPLLPDGPGKTVAIRALADARMKANRAVALEGKF